MPGRRRRAAGEVSGVSGADAWAQEEAEEGCATGGGVANPPQIVYVL